MAGCFLKSSLQFYIFTGIINGRFATLGDVLDFYSNPPPPEVGESELDPLELSDADKSDLIAFLETLNGAWPDLSAYATAWQGV